MDWDDLKALGPCEIHERTDSEELRGRAKYAEVILTNKVPFDRETLSELPKLKYIGVTATGFNIIDVEAAKERGVLVTNVPSYGTSSVAQMTFALLLELTQRAGHHSARVREGGWTRSQDWCFWDYPLVELEGLTLGIVGFGSIGRGGGEAGPGVWHARVGQHPNSPRNIIGRRVVCRFGGVVPRERRDFPALSVDSGNRSHGERGAN